SPDVQGMEYNLASYFLISTGNDAVGSHGQTPSNWWPGFDVNLGEAGGTRYAWSNVLRRDFSGGIVLLNPPGAATQNISLPGSMRNVGGSTVTSVTLPAASGAVLRTVQGTPLTASLSQAGGGLLATQTTLEARVVGAHPSRAAPALGLGRHLTSRKTHRRRHHHHSRRRHHGGHRAHAARRAGAHQRRLHAVLARISGVVRQASRGTVTI